MIATNLEPRVISAPYQRYGRHYLSWQVMDGELLLHVS